MSNKYYFWWKSNKPLLALFPAIVFWFTSMLFFMVGLRFNNPILVLGWDASTTIAVLLTLSNTFIQIIGNDQEADNMGMALYIGWIASYLLGVGTNVVGLLAILDVQNGNLEWAIALGLGTIIEVLPERLLVMFLKTWEGGKKQPNKPSFNPQQRPNTPYRPDAPAMRNIQRKPMPKPAPSGEMIPPWLKGK